jgi:hypothetical protein
MMLFNIFDRIIEAWVNEEKRDSKNNSNNYIFIVLSYTLYPIQFKETLQQLGL